MNPETDIVANHPLAGCEDEIEALRECGRLFHSRGWSVGTSSNYSAVVNRNPLELVVTASGKDKGSLGCEDFVRINLSGTPIPENQPKSSAETMLHVVLARMPDTGAILHTHSVWGTLLSDYYSADGGFPIEGYEMLKGLEGIRTHDCRLWMPILDNTQDIPVLAKQVETMLIEEPAKITHGFMIRNHGLYTWGKDVFSARRHVEVFEFLFEVLGRKTDFVK